jgi:phage repressor protein C with HTH and peptisase S24 domain
VIFNEFLKSYRSGVNVKTGKAFSLRALAELVGVDQWRLQKWEQGSGNPKDENDRNAIKKFFGIDEINDDISDEVLKSAIARYPAGAELTDKPSKPTGEDLRKKKAFGTDDDDERGLIYVPIAAQAGYTRNYSDPIYITQLDRLYIPGLPYKGDKYRYFDIEGDSMSPTIEEGMQVIGELVQPEDWIHAHDYYIYVIVQQNRILVKRVFKKDEHQLVIISDNEAYPQQLIPMESIKEMWYVKRILDWRMPPPKEIKITV